MQYCAWLNQGAMETLIAHLDCLENVDLTGCNGLSNDTLLPFVKKFKLVNIQWFNKSVCYRTRISPKKNLTESCFSNYLIYRLKKFLLMNLYRTVNDQTMLLIARERGDTLEFLDVSGCINVSDWGVK